MHKPDPEAAFIARLAEFDRAMNIAPFVTVRQYAGSPKFRPLADVPLAELERELESALDALKAMNVLVHFVKPETTTEQRYRFVTEELMEEEMLDVHLDGFSANFVYEEFLEEHEWFDAPIMYEMDRDGPPADLEAEEEG
jgi:hypothetical protein